MFGNKLLGKSIRRRGIALGGVAAFVGVFLAATAMPAWAHDTVLSGHAVCADGAHEITWTIGNSDETHTMHIESATAALGTEMFAVTGYSDISGSESTSATTTVPGGLTGDVTLTVQAIWNDGFRNSASASVTLDSGCSPTTTSTTVETTTTQASTTTTEAPTTTAAPSTTVAPASSTIPPTTTATSTPIVTEGTTAPPTTMISPVTAVSGSTSPDVTAAATPNTGALPFTGSGDSGPLIGLGSLLAGGVALAIARRRA